MQVKETLFDLNFLGTSDVGNALPVLPIYFPIKGDDEIGTGTCANAHECLLLVH